MTARSQNQGSQPCRYEDSVSMLTTEADPVMDGQDFEPANDRAMLVLQYVVASVAAAAAALLALVP